jgi:putative alpha-1,2-mannosidase
VQSLAWNGQPVGGTDFAYSDMMGGGELAFTMGPKPAFLVKDQEL